MLETLDEAHRVMKALGRRLYANGLAPATSGNYSVRLADGRIAITVSGRHKGRLRLEDVTLLDPSGRPLEDREPSAEADLHCSLYQLYPQVNSVIHVHSFAAIVLARHRSAAREILLEGYEMSKAFPGIATHETTVRVPVHENSQDIGQMARGIACRLELETQIPAYIVRGHGTYGWGRDVEEAERTIEALEHLLCCEIQGLQLRQGART